jgi:hypothetical protein
MLNVWDQASTANVNIYYIARSPWQWVMKEVVQHTSIKEVAAVGDLPTQQKRQEAMASNSVHGTPASTLSPASGNVAVGLTPLSSISASRLRRRQRSRGGGRVPTSLTASTLKLEIASSTGEVLFAVHGTSRALDGLEDKDELVRTIQRCRCEHLALSPPSLLINWDVTKEECVNVIGPKLPTLDPNANGAVASNIVAVLKEPLGSQGQGIYFVSSIDQIHSIIHENRERANMEPGLLDDLISRKGRIPSWGKSGGPRV